jgi:hypothetical protein
MVPDLHHVCIMISLKGEVPLIITVKAQYISMSNVHNS